MRNIPYILIVLVGLLMLWVGYRRGHAEGYIDALDYVITGLKEDIKRIDAESVESFVDHSEIPEK